jgi:hypothetical protein
LIHEALPAARVPLTCGARVPLRESVSLLSRRINAQFDGRIFDVDRRYARMMFARFALEVS